ncbi:integration host factor subunit alpha [Hephaestia caeni]|uniref:Integration host factor subunit alpha n=1 Tax=Hephaestia caeni TaxID=645617 RepID=A0A397P9U4_9SPHN|nr:integration host factor subunit alpha [Hephaestia caeni]RIA43945.1 integration host factor subunit alpha [Hephaestia caeni]
MSEAGTMTRADLADAIHREVGLSRADSARMVESILARMCSALADGENVKISGFGTFVLRDKGERIGRNPKTGVEVPIAPRRVLTFRASQMMRDRIVAAG